jgi:hypothetical protein
MPGKPFTKDDPRINRKGRPPGSQSFKAQVQEAFVDILGSKQGNSTYLSEWLEIFKKEALNPESKHFAFLGDRLFQQDVLTEVDNYLNKEKRENQDFLSYRIYKLAFDVQQQILSSMKKLILLMAGRRAGKTDVHQKKIVDTLVSKHDAKVLYIGMTLTTAINQIYNGVLELLDYLGVEPDEKRRNEGYIKIGEAEFFIKGNTTTDEREKLRGFKWDLVIIDEAQSQKSLPYLINDIIEPALVDRRGQLIISGTGPRVRGTYWEEGLWNNSQENLDCLALNWNMTQNPFIEDHKGVLEEIKQKKGLTDNSPLYIREYLGKISYDDDALVYRLTDKNYYTDEQLKQWIETQPVTDLHFSSGLDYGFEDADGYAIVLHSDSDDTIWLVHEYKERRTGVSTLVEEVQKGIKKVEALPVQDKHFYIHADTNP